MLARSTILAAIALGSAVATPPASAVPYVLTPDNTNLFIVGFNQATGVPISIEGKPAAVWLNVADFVDSSTINVLRHAAQIGSEIWITDQLSGVIHRFSAQFDAPRYIGFIDTIPNPRGLGVVNGEAWVASGGIGTSGGIARFSTSGQSLGSFDADDPFDVQAFGTFALTANINQNRLEIFQTDGT